MAAPKKHGCYEHCEKEVFDAKNARVILPIGKQTDCPALTPADITAIQNDIEAQFKGEIITQPCANDHCRCVYGAQLGWPANYDTLKLDWSAERKVGDKECKYTFKATVDTASVTVVGKCRRNPDAPPIKGKSKL